MLDSAASDVVVVRVLCRSLFGAMKDRSGLVKQFKYFFIEVLEILCIQFLSVSVQMFNLSSEEIFRLYLVEDNDLISFMERYLFLLEVFKRCIR